LFELKTATLSEGLVEQAVSSQTSQYPSGGQSDSLIRYGQLDGNDNSAGSKLAAVLTPKK
jgi:hypothetical protein